MPLKQVIILLFLAGIALVAGMSYFTEPDEETGIPAEGKVLFSFHEETGEFQLFERGASIYAALDGYQILPNIRQPDALYTQQMLAHLPVFFRPQAKKVLVLGNDYGITAAVFGLYDHTSEISAVFPLKGVTQAQEILQSLSYQYQQVSKIKTHTANPVEFLEKSQQKWDIISLPAGPFVLDKNREIFHLEFFQLLAERLSPDGLIALHLPRLYERRIFSGLKQVFPYLRITPAYVRKSHIVLASRTPLPFDKNTVKELTQPDSIQNLMAELGITPPLSPELMFAGMDRAEDLPFLFTEPPFTADDPFPDIGILRALLKDN